MKLFVDVFFLFDLCFNFIRPQSPGNPARNIMLIRAEYLKPVSWWHPQNKNTHPNKARTSAGTTTTTTTTTVTATATATAAVAATVTTTITNDGDDVRNDEIHHHLHPPTII